MRLFVNQQAAHILEVEAEKLFGAGLGWKRKAFQVRFDEGDYTGLTVLQHEHEPTGLVYRDLLNGNATRTEIVEADTGYMDHVYPGAGLPFTTWPATWDLPVESSIYPGATRCDGVAKFWPDYPYTARTGSPRCTLRPKFWHAFQAASGFEGCHVEAARYLEFQLWRNYLNPHPYNGRFDDERRPSLEGRSIATCDAGYPKETALWGYDVPHLTVAEEAGISAGSGDPRAYMFVERQVLHAGRWAWYIGGKSSNAFDDNSRNKGRWLAACAYALDRALWARHDQLRDEVLGFLKRDIPRIMEQWDRPDRVTPSRTPPDGRHIKTAWSDCSWMVATMVHGADLLMQACDVGMHGQDPALPSHLFLAFSELRKEAHEIRSSGAAVLAEEFMRNGVLYEDICSDGSSPELWRPYTKGEGTAHEIAEALLPFAPNHPAVVWIQAWRAGNNREPYLPASNWMPRL